MKFSIIVPDGKMVVDGKTTKLDLSKLVKLGIRVVHFNDASNTGEIEYSDGETRNKKIDSYEGYGSYLEAHYIQWNIDHPKISEEQLKLSEETNWRNSQLAVSDIELFKVQDGRGVGNVGDWRDYRNELRDYPESKGFPNSTRPISPLEESNE